MVSKKPGRPPKTKPAIEPIAPAAWDRIRRLVARGALDPIHGSEVGRLSYQGELTATEVSAAIRVAEIYGRYERVLGRHRSARSPSYEMGFSGQTPEAQQRSGRLTEEEEAKQAKLSFEKLQDEIPVFPRTLKARFEELVVEDKPISAADLVDVRELLGKLATAFGVVSAGKNRPRAERRKPVPKGEKRDGAAPPPPEGVDQACFRKMMATLRPDLKEDQVDSAYDVYCALRAREVYRRQKTRVSAKIINLKP